MGSVNNFRSPSMNDNESLYESQNVAENEDVLYEK